MFSKQRDSVVKYTLIVFKDKVQYFFTVWVTRNYENEKKGIYCTTHKLDDMIDLTHKKCKHVKKVSGEVGDKG
mgnify:CR=1 FL=1